jgi:hypothetical protein
MPEKKHSRISVRINPSWKRKFQERGISISLICRSALFQALQQTDPVLRAGSKMQSKQQAAALWNALRALVVRTIPVQFELELRKQIIKTPFFRSFCLPGAMPQELIILGEFLDQGEYAEEILQTVYGSDKIVVNEKKDFEVQTSIYDGDEPEYRPEFNNE